MHTPARYPPPPWHLQGQALLRLQLLPIEEVRPLVPKELRVVPVLPGRTLAALYLARYGEGSSLTYHELIVAPAMVQSGAKIGGWISHIYVDSHASEAGGREVWALPKQQAQFSWQSWDSGCEIEVAQAQITLCHLRVSTYGRGITVPLLAPIVARDEDRLLSFKGVGSGRIRRGYGDLAIPAQSPFAGLGLRGGRQLFLERLNLRMSAPRG